MLVAPALPTNDPKNSWSTGGGLGRKLRFAAVRAILQVHCLRAPVVVCTWTMMLKKTGYMRPWANPGTPSRCAESLDIGYANTLAWH